MEASSHGLDQHRLDGVRVAAGGFTNLAAIISTITRPTNAYLAAKLMPVRAHRAAGRQRR